MSDSGGTPNDLRPPLILASASPRRIEILAAAGILFQVVPSGIEERPPQPLAPLRLAQWAAGAKAATVAARFPEAAVLAADTVVALNGRAYGKPADRAEARTMLAALSGRTHLVYTAVVVMAGRPSKLNRGFSRTFVTMRDLSPSVIARYVGSGEPQDKAGAYAIQGEGRRLVRSIRGPFDNVVGMPMHLVERLLQGCGITIPAINAHEAQHDPPQQRPRPPRAVWRRADPPAAGRAGAGRLRPGGQFPAGDHAEL